jgi:hypothetical protein
MRIALIAIFGALLSLPTVAAGASRSGHASHGGSSHPPRMAALRLSTSLGTRPKRVSKLRRTIDAQRNRAIVSMAKIFAQHAMAGEYHLETQFVSGQWEWKVIAIRHKLPEYTGTASSLEGAKKSAMVRIGLMKAEWTNVGPGIEVPDDHS